MVKFIQTVWLTAALFLATSSAQALQVPAAATQTTTAPQTAAQTTGTAQTTGVAGTVTDEAGEAIPAASIVVQGPDADDHRTATAADDATFVVDGLRPGVNYNITISSPGFADWHSGPTLLTSGQLLQLNHVQMIIKMETQTVTAIPPEQVAIEEVHTEEQQRVLGIIPNFYVVYDNRVVALSTKLKFQLAFRATTDVISFAAAAFIAGINQAADHPDYVQGARGFGQRFGAAYADAATDIMFGGAVLPSLLHQDPRYFYQGTGSKKSRALHALSAPFIAKGDNGRSQFNYSSIGGDLISGALSNIYYPPSNRGPALVFDNAAIATGGRMLNALLQEFVLSKFTTSGKRHSH